MQYQILAIATFDSHCDKAEHYERRLLDRDGLPVRFETIEDAETVLCYLEQFRLTPMYRLSVLPVPEEATAAE